MFRGFYGCERGGRSGGETIFGEGAELPRLEGFKLRLVANFDLQRAVGLAVNASGDSVAAVDDEFSDGRVDQKMKVMFVVFRCRDFDFGTIHGQERGGITRGN